jgi:hypothetical protein
VGRRYCSASEGEAVQYTHRLVAVLILIVVSVAGLTSAVSAASGDVDCASFGSREAAQHVLDGSYGDPHHLDADADGKACERLPKAFWYIVAGADAGMLVIFTLFLWGTPESMGKSIRDIDPGEGHRVMRASMYVWFPLLISLPMLLLALPFAWLYIRAGMPRAGAEASPMELAKQALLWGGGVMAVLMTGQRVVAAIDHARHVKLKALRANSGSSTATKAALTIAGTAGEWIARIVGLVALVLLLAAIGSQCSPPKPDYQDCYDQFFVCD